VEALVALVLVEVLVVVALVVVVLEVVVLVVVAGAFKSHILNHPDFNNHVPNNPLSSTRLSKHGFSHQRGMPLPPSTHGKFKSHIFIPGLKCQLTKNDNVLLLKKKIVNEQQSWFIV
jgi:hypothetical protein